MCALEPGDLGLTPRLVTSHVCGFGQVAHLPLPPFPNLWRGRDAVPTSQHCGAKGMRSVQRWEVWGRALAVVVVGLGAHACLLLQPHWCHL